MYFDHIFCLFIEYYKFTLCIKIASSCCHMVFTAQVTGSNQPAWRTDFHSRTDIAQTPFSQLCVRIKMSFLRYWQNKPKSQIKMFVILWATELTCPLRVQGFEPLVHLGWKLHQIISQSNRSSPVYMGMKLVRKKMSLTVSIMML